MTMAPIVCEWDGECLFPRPMFAKACDAGLVIGQCYRIEFIEEHSEKSRRFYFATLDDIFASLPENNGRFTSREQMRHAALIATGYADFAEFAFRDDEQAFAFANYTTAHEPYAVVVQALDSVAVWRAESQARNGGMDKQRFQDSTRDVLSYCAELIGVLVEQFTMENAQ